MFVLLLFFVFRLCHALNCAIMSAHTIMFVFCFVLLFFSYVAASHTQYISLPIFQSTQFSMCIVIIATYVKYVCVCLRLIFMIVGFVDVIYFIRRIWWINKCVCLRSCSTWSLCNSCWSKFWQMISHRFHWNAKIE